MHFDRDEGRFGETGEVVHPFRSSVYYVNTNDSPTCIVRQRCTSDMRALVPTEPTSGVLCHPIANSLCVFDGRYLHGVLPSKPRFHIVNGSIESNSAASNEHRITLMMNFWCEPLRDKTCIAFPTHEQGQRYDTLMERYGRMVNGNEYKHGNETIKRYVTTTCRPS